MAAQTIQTGRLQSKLDSVARQQRQKELAEVTRKLDGLIQAIADGLRSPGLQQTLTALEESKRRLEHDMAGAIAPAPTLHPNLAQLYRQKVATLHVALADPQSRDEALGLIRGLVEAVALRPLETGFEIELVGEIANMVALAAGADFKNNKAVRSGAAVDGVFRRSVKVVAGARNHLNLLLGATVAQMIRPENQSKTDNTAIAASLLATTSASPKAQYHC